MREAKILAVSVASLLLIAWAVAPVLGKPQPMHKILQAESDVWEPLLVAGCRTITGFGGSEKLSFDYKRIDESAKPAGLDETTDIAEEEVAASATAAADTSSAPATSNAVAQSTSAQESSADAGQATADNGSDDWSDFVSPDKNDQEIVNTEVAVAIQNPPPSNSTPIIVPPTPPSTPASSPSSSGHDGRRNRRNRHKSVQKEVQSLSQTVDESLESGTLSGTGCGRSSRDRSRAFRNMIDTASALIEKGHTGAARDILENAYSYCDGKRHPADLVEGRRRSQLADQISELLSLID